MTPNNLIIGFVPLLDCAALVVAVEKGLMAQEGLEVTLVRETSWANIRDRIMVDHFDAAQMLGPMAIAASLGVGHLTVPMVAPISLGLGGNAITVSNALWQEMHEQGAQLNADPAAQGQALKKVVMQHQQQNRPVLTFGMVYPFSCHNYELRYWLSASGIDPDHDVQLVVIPPPLLVDALREGQIDGFCVGEPWNSVAVEADAGVIVNTTTQIWRLSPEKVLGCRASWAKQHPEQVAGLIRAIYRAAQWCEQPANHPALASILAKPRYVGAPVDILLRALGGQLRLAPGTEPVDVPDFFIMHRQQANFPWASHALWYYTQMVRWKQAAYSQQAVDAVRSTYRPDLYRSALVLMDESIPMTDYKTERAVSDRYVVNDDHASLTLSAEGFFDSRIYEPTDIEGYIKAFG